MGEDLPRTARGYRGSHLRKDLVFQEKYLRTIFFQWQEKKSEEPRIKIHIRKYGTSPPGHARRKARATHECMKEMVLLPQTRARKNFWCLKNGARICPRGIPLRAAVNLQLVGPSCVQQEKFQHRWAKLRQPKVWRITKASAMKRAHEYWGHYQPYFRLEELRPTVLKKNLAERSWDQRVSDVQKVGEASLVGRDPSTAFWSRKVSRPRCSGGSTVSFMQARLARAVHRGVCPGCLIRYFQMWILIRGSSLFFFATGKTWFASNFPGTKAAFSNEGPL